MRQVGLQHVLGLHLQALHFGALREVLLLGQVVQQVVDPLEGVLDLHEVGLHVLAVGDLCGAFSDGSPLRGIGLPVVAAELGDELVTLLIVHLGSVEVLGHVARDEVERVSICVESLNEERGTSMGSMLRILFSMDGKWNS